MFARRVSFNASVGALFTGMHRAASNRPTLSHEDGSVGYVSRVEGTLLVDVYFPDGVPPVLTVLDVVDGRNEPVSMKVLARLNAKRGRCIATTKFLKLQTKCVARSTCGPGRESASVIPAIVSTCPPVVSLLDPDATTAAVPPHIGFPSVSVATGAFPPPLDLYYKNPSSDLLGPHVVEIDVSHSRLTVAEFEVILRQCPNVEAIKAKGCCPPSDAFWEMIAAWCPKLRHLDFTNGWSWTTAGLEAILRQYPNVEVIKLKKCRGFSRAPWKAIAACSKLRYLDVSECSGRSITDADISLIAAKCSYLEHLAVSGAPGISDVGIAAVAALCPQIRHLDASRCNISDVALSALAANCHQLRHLDVSRTHTLEITDSGVAEIAKGCPRMQLLNLESGDVGDIGMGAIAANCPHLKYLDMGWCKGSISDRGIAAIGTHCPQLKHLNVSYTRASNFTDAGLVVLATNCRHLEHLDIRDAGAHHITDVTFEALAANCRRMRLLNLWHQRTRFIDSAFKASCPDCEILGGSAMFSDMRSTTSVAASCPFVQDLDVNGKRGINDVGIATVAAHSPELWHLYTKLHNGLISEVEKGDLAANCRQLRHLNMRDTRWKITDSIIVEIAKSCPQLQHLDLRSCDVGDVGICAIAGNCSHLEHLDMRYCKSSRISDTGITAIGTHCLQLKHLDVGHTSGTFTDVGLNVLATNCRQLKHLDISYAGCKITGVTFEALAANCFNLEYLNLRSFTDGINLSDADLVVLAKCPKLWRLDVDSRERGSLFTRAGLTAFETLFGRWVRTL